MAYYAIQRMVNNVLTGATSEVLDADYTYGKRYTYAKAFERVEKMGIHHNFVMDGNTSVTSFAGRFVVPEIGIIRSVTLYVGTTGDTGDGTTIDVLKNAASLFTTATNPTVPYDAAASAQFDKVTTFDSDAEATVAVGDVITATITQVASGTVATNASVVVCIQPNSDTV